MTETTNTPKRYLITGVAGFIGSNLLEWLLTEGHQVVGLDNFATGHRHNIEPYANDFEFIEGDIRDPKICATACAKVDVVLHQAALGSVPRSVADPLTTHEVNTTGTLNMLVAARDASVGGFVFAASSSAYGDTPTLPKVETMPVRPMSPYAVTKATCESYIKVFAELYDLNAVGLRYFNIFGPRQDPNGQYAAVIPKFAQALLAGDTPTIFGDGDQTRDFTFVANAVHANYMAGEFAERAKGEIVNIACGDRISINDLYYGIAERLGVEQKPNYEQKRAGDVRDSLADIGKAETLIEYCPSVPWREGLDITTDWFRQQFEAS